MTEALTQAGHVQGDSLYGWLRQDVQYYGPSRETAVELYHHIDGMNGMDTSGFIGQLARAFRARLSTEEHNFKYLNDEVTKFIVHYQV